MARTIRQCTATYNESRELIQIGAYRQGSDPRVDQAVMIHPYIDEFTQQDFRAVIPYAQSVEDMKKIAMILIGDAQKRTEQLQRQQHQAAKNNPLPNNAFTRSDRQG